MKDIERELETNLDKSAKKIECSQNMYFKIKNKFTNDVINKGEDIKMKKKKLVMNTVAMAIAVIIPVASLAAPHVIKVINTITLKEKDVEMVLSEYQAEEGNLTQVQKNGIERGYEVFPDLKDFEIVSINGGEGRVGYELMDWSSIQLEKGKEKITLDIDNVTGDYTYIGIEKQGVNYDELSNEEIISKAKKIIEGFYGDTTDYKYEFKNYYDELNQDKKSVVADNGSNIGSERMYLDVSSESGQKNFKVDYSNENKFEVRILNR